MTSFGALFIVLLCAPVYLLPAVAAFRNRKNLRWLILGANLALLIFALYFLENWGNHPLHPAIVEFFFALTVVLGSWLALLHVGTRKDVPDSSAVDEVVEVVPYDTQWPGMFAAESQRVSATLMLGDGDLEHIGSTAVPGLIAKPVIDMMLGVPRFPEVGDFISRLAILGYQNLGEAGVPGRIYLRSREDIAFNLHLVQRGGDHWTNNLTLRDLLRRDTRARERYAQAKQAALASGANRLLAYSAAKRSVVDELLAEARHG